MEIKLTLKEIKDIIAEKYNIQEDFEFSINEVARLFKVEDVLSYGKCEWIDVPVDWDNPWCPDLQLKAETKIDILFRCGIQEEHHICHIGDLAWVQDGHDFDIIKYRVVQEPES